MTELGFPWPTFLVFAFVNCVTPGPNVILLASSGSKWGFKESVPAILGVSVGFPLMLFIVQMGAGPAFQYLPWLFPTLTVTSLIYILYLSLKIWRMGKTEASFNDGRQKAVSFFNMISFQWINAKAWQMVLMTATLYATDKMEIKLLGCLAFAIILLVTASFWVEVGKRISSYLKNPGFRKVYYGILAVSLILSTFPTGISQLRSFLGY